MLKYFNIITRINKAKCDCNCQFDNVTCILNEIGIDNKCQCECKKYRMWKKDYSWNSSISIYKNSSYFKSIVDHPVIVCEEIM